jgi:hypothetical protein
VDFAKFNLGLSPPPLLLPPIPLNPPPLPRPLLLLPFAAPPPPLLLLPHALPVEGGAFAAVSRSGKSKALFTLGLL